MSVLTLRRRLIAVQHHYRRLFPRQSQRYQLRSYLGPKRLAAPRVRCLQSVQMSLMAVPLQNVSFRTRTPIDLETVLGRWSTDQSATSFRSQMIVLGVVPMNADQIIRCLMSSQMESHRSVPRPRCHPRHHLLRHPSKLRLVPLLLRQRRPQPAVI